MGKMDAIVIEVLAVKGAVGYAMRDTTGLKVGLLQAEEGSEKLGARTQALVGIFTVLQQLSEGVVTSYKIFVQESVALRLIGLRKRLEKMKNIDAVIDYHKKSLTEEEGRIFSALTHLWYGLESRGFVINFANARTLFSYEVELDSKLDALPAQVDIDHSKIRGGFGRVKDINVLTGSFETMVKSFKRKDGSVGGKWYVKRASTLADGKRYDANEICTIIKRDPGKLIGLCDSESRVAWVNNLVGHMELIEIMPKITLKEDYNKAEVKNGSIF